MDIERPARSTIASGFPVGSEMAENILDSMMGLMGEVKRVARQYYVLTGKPLGVTGEVAEYEAARIMRLQLAPAREASYDALTTQSPRVEKIQIKGRAVDPSRRYVGRVPKMRLEPRFNKAILVLLDRSTMEALEIWQAEYDDVKRRLTDPGSRARNERLSMGISQFRSIATLVWSA